MGEPAATARPILLSRLSGYLQAGRGEDPCGIQMDVPLRHGSGTHAADIVAAPESALFGPQHVTEPELIVEVFDNTTFQTVFFRKLPEYRKMPSVKEILLVASDLRQAELHRRGGPHWFLDMFPSNSESIALTSVGIEITLAELYEGIVFDEQLAG